jgi:uncharacterized membrane protein
MKRFFRFFFFSFLFCFSFISFSFFCSFKVFAKDYSFPSSEFSVFINDDGSFVVEEERTYSFSGSFSWADMWIPLDGFTISSFQIGDESGWYEESNVARSGSYYTETANGRFYAKWFFSALDEQKTFIIKYKIDDGIKLHKDIAEFYWKLIGSEWEKGVFQVSGGVLLPSNVSDNLIYCFGHGPLNGNVSIPSKNECLFSVNNLPEKQFLEIRMLFDKNVITNSSLLSDDKTLQTILAEEEKFARETERKKNLLRFALFFCFGLLSLLTVLGLYFIFKASGAAKKLKDKIIAENGLLSQKLHDPASDLPPAEVEALVSLGKIVTPKSFLATILDLVRRRFWKIQRSSQKKGFLFKDYKYWLEPVEKGEFKKGKNKKSISYNSFFSSFSSKDPEKILKEFDNLSHKSYEGLLVNYLSLQTDENQDQKIEFDEIKEYGKKHSVSSQMFFKSFQVLVKASLKKKDLFDSSNKDWKVILYFKQARFFGFFFLVLIIPELTSLPVVLTLLNFNWLIYLSLAVLAGQLLGFVLMVKSLDFAGFTKKGYIEKLKWLAFKKYLTDFSVTDDDTVDSIIIWEKMLVYGTALGVSVKTLASLPVSFSAPDKRTFTAYYAGMSASDFGTASFNNSFSSLASTLKSLSTSSNYGASGSGSSGGFSGGGGGGGGGSGGGGAG